VITTITFVIFLCGTHFVLMKIFTLTTYHKYFKPAFPLLLGHAFLVGYLLFKLNLSAFFLWLILLESAWLFFIIRKNRKLFNFRLQGIIFDKFGIIPSGISYHKDIFVDYICRIFKENTEARDEFLLTRKSGLLTEKYFFISSLCYLVATSVSFLLFFNLK